MITAYVPDVGDGMAAGIMTIDHCNIQIDCGSQQCSEEAFHKGLVCIDPDVFFVSHFHFDHYNGLWPWDNVRLWPRLTVKEVYFPRVPEFPQRNIFLRSMLAMNHWLMGDISGSMEGDFLRIMSQINHRVATYRALSSGDKVQVGRGEIEVLWPPRVVDDNHTLKLIKKAISDFEAAKDKDDRLRRIYDKLGDSGEMEPYIGAGEEGGELPGRAGEPWGTKHVLIGALELPEVVKQANESLRGAANHLSLAFHEDNRLLFMGDLEAPEIKQVVAELLRKQRDHFLVLITPHHGTHWQKDLGKLHVWWAISSVGDHLFKHLRPDFKSIAEECLYTHLSGDIEVPVLPLRHGHRKLRCCLR